MLSLCSGGGRSSDDEEEGQNKHSVSQTDTMDDRYTEILWWGCGYTCRT